MSGRLKRILFKPFHYFFQLQASGGILLIVATVFALLWANSVWADTYEAFWQLPLGLHFGALGFVHSLRFWINDGLMALFFLVVGLEIKRELLVGELSTRKKAVLPFMAALGGMVFPAVLYVFVTGLSHPNLMPGWGISTVTDIAFALGVLAILGDRVPLGLKVFLTALAIIDDLGAILLIALFYSQSLQLDYLWLILGLLLLLFILNRFRIHHPVFYCLLGLLLWLAVLQSGLHATIAGVLLALAIPARSRINPDEFYNQATANLQRFHQANRAPDTGMMLTNEEHQASVQALETACESVQSPLQKLEHGLHPWVSYGILPLFALANAGVSLPQNSPLQAIMNPVAFGVILGLFLGKQLGITVFAWLAVRVGWAELPQGVRWPLIYGASILGGVGFTMSLFIAVLAFQDAEQVINAKMGVLLASLISGLVGVAVLWWLLRRQQPLIQEPETLKTDTN